MVSDEGSARCSQVAALLADLQSCAHVSCCLAAWQLDRHAEQESVRVDGLAAARLLVRVAHGPGGSPGIHGHIRGETVKRTGGRRGMYRVIFPSCVQRGQK